VDKFKTAYDNLGLQLKLLPSRRFLSQFRVGDKTWPLGGRIIQQTCFNEHEPLGKQMLPINILGLRERWGTGPMPQFTEPVREVLKMTTLYETTGVFDGPSARAWLASSQGTKALAATLERLANSDWMAAIIRDAEFSASAAALLDAVEDLGLKVDTSYERQGWSLVEKMLRLTPERRMTVGLTIGESISGGPTAMDAMAIRMLA
jgi:hypothetical protein